MNHWGLWNSGVYVYLDSWDKINVSQLVSDMI